MCWSCHCCQFVHLRSSCIPPAPAAINEILEQQKTHPLIQTNSMSNERIHVRIFICVLSVWHCLYSNATDINSIKYWFLLFDFEVKIMHHRNFSNTIVETIEFQFFIAQLFEFIDKMEKRATQNNQTNEKIILLFWCECVYSTTALDS